MPLFLTQEKRLKYLFCFYIILSQSKVGFFYQQYFQRDQRSQFDFRHAGDCLSKNRYGSKHFGCAVCDQTASSNNLLEVSRLSDTFGGTINTLEC